MNRRWFAISPRELVVNMIASMVLPGIYVMVAWLNDSFSASNILLGTMAMIALSLFGINQFNRVFPRQSKSLTDDELKRDLHQYLLSQGFGIDPPTPWEHGPFAFGVSDTEQRKVMVFKRFEKFGGSLSTGSTFYPDRVHIESLTATKRLELRAELTLELTRFGV